jgi:DnaJ-class molecular chaperone
MSERDKCKTCKGDKVVDNEKILEVPVEQGTMDGKRCVFSGEGDEYPEIQPGDVVIVFKIEPHKEF